MDSSALIWQWYPNSGHWPSISLIARFMGPTWDPPGDDRTQVGPMLAPWTLLSGLGNCWEIKLRETNWKQNTSTSYQSYRIVGLMFKTRTSVFLSNWVVLLFYGAHFRFYTIIQHHIYQWASARKTWLQCISNVVISFLHWPINMMLCH